MVDIASFHRPRSHSAAAGHERHRDAQVLDLTERAGDRPLLIVHSSDDMYGADRMVLEVIAALPARDRARTIVWLPADYAHGATPLCERLVAEGIACEHVPLPVVRRRYLNARGLVALASRAFDARRRIALLNPSDVILATSATLPLAAFITRSESVRVILHLQEIWQGREAQVLGALAGRVDRIIAISEASRASLPEHLSGRTVVVPNGTADPGATDPVSSRSGDLTFVVASRWNAWKGHEVLIRAWDEADCPGTLVILGGPPSMGTAVDVPGFVRSSRRPETIRLLGEVPDAGAEIAKADVMIVPSTQPEPFGLVTIEAFARARPVVASANGGLLETVREGAGWLVEPGSVPALANALRGLDRAQVALAGARARERYEQQYSIEAFQDGLRGALDMDAVAMGDHAVLAFPRQTIAVGSAGAAAV
jgi:glycosyltransferase involved in cell wall biosynthesis